MNPILKKLGYKTQNSVLILTPPPELAEIIKDIEGEIHTSSTQTYDFILLFARGVAEAETQIAGAIASLTHDGHLWLCYPKGSSKKYRSDLNREGTWDIVKPFNFRPVSQVALDEDWSAVRVRDTNLVKTK